MVPAEGVRNILGTDGWFEWDEQHRPPAGKVASVSESVCYLLWWVPVVLCDSVVETCGQGGVVAEAPKHFCSH